jgi:hypothetical protein
VRLDAATGLLARPCSGRIEETSFTWPPAADRDGILPLELWARDQGWPEPPWRAAPCLCGEAACAPLDAPSRGSARGDVALASFRERGPTTTWRNRDTGASWKDRNAGPGRSPDGGDTPSFRILSPADGTIYALDPSLPAGQQEIGLAASGHAAVLWFVDGRPIGTSPPGERLFWRLRPGAHRIRAVPLESSGDAPGAADEVRIEIEAGAGS